MWKAGSCVMEYVNIDYLYSPLWFILSVSFARVAWKDWKTSDRVDVGLNLCLSVLCLILSVLTFKEGLGS